jgi:hypothetical protein
MEGLGGAVEQAEAVCTQEKVLGLDAPHDVGGRRLEPARFDVLKGDVEFELPGLAAVDGRSD